MIQPETQFAAVGNDRVAYQLLGDGPRDLLYTTGMWSHLDVWWENAAFARFMRRLASFSRLIRFDHRGSGLSDPAPEDGLSPVQHWVADAVAVLDAVGSRAPVIVGAIDSGPLVLEFVAHHPDRCSALVLINTTACFAARPDYPEGHSPETLRKHYDFLSTHFGRLPYIAKLVPSQAGNEANLQWAARVQRTIASPRHVLANLEVLTQLDARPGLAGIRVPTLVMTRRDLRFLNARHGRYIADHISGARFVELPGADAFDWWETPDLILDQIEEFVTGRRAAAESERALLAVLFLDIVNSTPLAAQVGDSNWHALLNRHDRITREQVALFGGRVIERAGDGTLATFERPGRAIDCAQALHEALAPLGLALRAGLHFGEVELREDGRLGGLALHIGARIMGLARAGEVLVSPTVQGILLGSHYRFDARGDSELRGIPGRWALFAALPSAP